jgi:hypothetical protein
MSHDVAIPVPPDRRSSRSNISVAARFITTFDVGRASP